MHLQQRTDALLELIEAYRARRCAELLGPAQEQARRLRRSALSAARSRVHTAIAEQRARLAAEVGAAQARLATDRRLVAQRHASVMLAQAWSALRAALIARWQSSSLRAQWVESHLDRAAASLPHERWEIRHPHDWVVAERDTGAARLAACGIAQVDFRADPAIDAGIRVIAGHNVMDATLDGLLADRAALEGRLLQLLEETL